MLFYLQVNISNTLTDVERLWEMLFSITNSDLKVVAFLDFEYDIYFRI